MNRRQVLLGGMGFVACAGVSVPGVSLFADMLPPAETSLKAAGACSGMKIGISTDKASLQDANFARIVVDNFNLLTASGMKWAQVHPGPDTYDFSEADWSMNFAKQNNLGVHGHNLCWNSAATNPPWFKSVLNKSNARQYLTDHITTVMKRYEGRIGSWDVVNEPVVSWPGRSDGLYPGMWLDLLGPEYIDIAFHAAASADPKPLRILNIHHVEQGGSDDELTRQRALVLVKQLVGRGVPVQAVGFESHLDASHPMAGSSLQQFIHEIRALNLQVLITELDVKENRATGGSRNWDETVAKYYGDYLAESIPAAAPQFVIFWSLKDRWENGGRIQGLMQDNLTPRLSYEAAVKAIQEDPRCRGQRGEGAV